MKVSTVWLLSEANNREYFLKLLRDFFGLPCGRISAFVVRDFLSLALLGARDGVGKGPACGQEGVVGWLGKAVLP